MGLLVNWQFSFSIYGSDSLSFFPSFPLEVWNLEHSAERRIRTDFLLYICQGGAQPLPSFLMLWALYIAVSRLRTTSSQTLLKDFFLNHKQMLSLIILSPHFLQIGGFSDVKTNLHYLAVGHGSQYYFVSLELQYQGDTCFVEWAQKCYLSNSFPERVV